MKDKNLQKWRLDRNVSISVLIQLVLLGMLIVGSWVNLQRNVYLLQCDVTTLLQCQKNFEQKLETLTLKSVSLEYRLHAAEKHLQIAELPKQKPNP